MAQETQGRTQKKPKRTGRSFMPLIALFWAAAMVGLGLLFLKILDELRKPRPGGSRSSETIQSLLISPSEQMNISLFFISPDGQALVAEDRQVEKEGGLAMQIRTALEELAKGPLSGAIRSVPQNLSVHSVFEIGEDVMAVDVGSEIRTGLPGGSTLELLCVHSIVNTVTQNFPQVKRVRILVEGREVKTLLGHVDLSEPLPAARGWIRGSAGSAPF